LRRTEALQGVHMAMFLNLLHRWESAELSQAEAAELLGAGERTFRRWQTRYEEDGEAGLLDRWLGKASSFRSTYRNLAKQRAEGPQRGPQANSDKARPTRFWRRLLARACEVFRRELSYGIRQQ
jgi:hypothetical protein